MIEMVPRILHVCREAGAPLVLAILLLTIAAALRRGNRRPLGLLGPLSVGLLVAWETVLLNVLSLFHAVTAGWVLAGNGLALALLGCWLRNPVTAVWRLMRAIGASIRGWRVEWLIVPLAVILCVIACAYPPTTHDAMTYHMARVAHWIGNQSVGFYQTTIGRQNWMSPGAEYLILLLQLVSGSDLWANSVQWLSWVLTLMAVPALCRIAGVPRRLCPWTAVFVAGLPMGILQASSTQTDMVGSLMMLGLATACLPLLHGVRRWSGRDLTIGALMLGGAYMVKPTALLAASPFLLYVAAGALRRPGELGRHALRLLRCAVPAVFLLACVALPHAWRASIQLRDPACLAADGHPRALSFGLLGDWSERALNPFLCTYAHHSVGREAVADAVQRLGVDWGQKAAAVLSRRSAWVLHEDLTGNPVHFFAGVVLAMWTLLVARRLRPGVRAFACVPFLAWIMMHLFVRNQPWISRLQLPVFVMLPLAWTAAAATGLPRARVRQAVLMAFSVLVLAVGYYDATHTLGKPVLPRYLGGYTREDLYYLYRPEGLMLKVQHDATIARASAIGGKHIGLMLGNDDYDYPLTWRAMQQGFIVRHCNRTSPWPDVIFQP